MTTPSYHPLDAKITDRSSSYADQTSRIVRELMKNFVVRSAVEPQDRGEKVIKAWHEAAAGGR